MYQIGYYYQHHSNQVIYETKNQPSSSPHPCCPNPVIFLILYVCCVTRGIWLFSHIYFDTWNKIEKFIRLIVWDLLLYTLKKNDSIISTCLKQCDIPMAHHLPTVHHLKRPITFWDHLFSPFLPTARKRNKFEVRENFQWLWYLSLP